MIIGDNSFDSSVYKPHPSKVELKPQQEPCLISLQAHIDLLLNSQLDSKLTYNEAVINLWLVE